MKYGKLRNDLEERWKLWWG